MNKRIICILFLFSLFFSLIPPSSSFIVGPGVVYIVTNGPGPDEFYEMDRNIDFNNITVDLNWISFNAIGFNVTGDDQLFINLSQINADPKHPVSTSHIISFNISASPVTDVRIKLDGLKTAYNYLVYNDSVSYIVKTNASGTLRFNRSLWAVMTHSYRIDDNSSLPVVQTNATTDISTTSAVINGFISSIGGANITAYGFQYGLTSTLGTTVNFTQERNPQAGGAALGMWDTRWYSQSFMIGFNGTNVSHLITGASFYTYRSDLPGNIYVRLYAANSTWGPTGAILASGSINGNVIDTNLHWRPINFTTPYFAHKGERLVIVLGMDGAMPGQIYWGTSSSTFHIGTRFFSNDAGATFHIYTGDDFAFQLLGYNRTFNKSLSGLPLATRYHHRAFANNSYGTGQGSDVQFLTKPESPILATATPGVGGVTLAWTNPSKGAGVNRTIYIRYKNGSAPTTRADGFFVVNQTSPLDTDSYFTPISGSDTWFSLWTFINCSTLTTFSPTYTTLHSSGSGGSYNITVRYENWTQNFVNLSQAGPHTLYFFGSNITRYIRLSGYTTEGDLSLNLSAGSIRHQLTHGYLRFNLSFTPYHIQLKWNDIYGVDVRCNRIIVPGDLKNITFWIYTDKFVYGESTSVFNDSLVPWTYSFIDNTGVFLNRPELDTYAYIYTYTPNGTRMIIHSEYLDTYKRVYPWLLYGKDYYIGISCTVGAVDNIGFAPTETDTSGTTSLYVVINLNTTTYYPNYVIHSGYSPGAAGIYVYYYDNWLAVLSSYIRVYDFENGSLMFTDSSTASLKNYSFPTASHDRGYFINLQINSSHIGLSLVYNITIYPGVAPRWDYTNINNTLNAMFGASPFRSYEHPSGTAQVPWMDVLVFTIFLFLLFSISGYNAPLSGLVSGGWFVFAGAMIANSPVIWVTMGVIIMVMSFLYAWGER